MGAFVTSYICPTDTLSTSHDNDISVNELESALSAIPGTKVVILDSCFSGGFIGKGKEKLTISKEDLTSFNDSIINIFSQSQLKGLLTTNQYKVLTASHYDQSSYGNISYWDCIYLLNIILNNTQGMGTNKILKYFPKILILLL